MMMQTMMDDPSSQQEIMEIMMAMHQNKFTMHNAMMSNMLDMCENDSSKIKKKIAQIQAHPNVLKSMKQMCNSGILQRKKSRTNASYL